MCGIAGIIGTDIKVRDASLKAMSDHIAHRGPDAAGTWSDAGIALAHRRLSVLDLSPAGHQPMQSSCGRYVLVFNGEIYNFVELREGLKLSGTRFFGHSDSEVLLAMYARHGSNCLEKLNGMWAFGVWDRENRSFFASRDRFGKKPLYYYAKGRTFFFASEIKALLATGQVTFDPNPLAIADFCSERVTDHTGQTFFRGVYQLPPAHWLLWKDGVVTTGRYWSLPGDTQADPPERLVEEVHDLLHDAVGIRLRSDITVGTLLSGGLDSSGITCIAAGLMNGPLHAFSTIGQIPVEEAAGIAHVEHACGNIELHVDKPNFECLTTDLERCLWHQEEPFGDGSMVAHFRLMRFARDNGVRVLLSGQGADEVFAGYPGYLHIHLASLLAKGSWLETGRLVAAASPLRQKLVLGSVLGYALPISLARWMRRAKRCYALDWLAEGYNQPSPDVSLGYTGGRGTEWVNDALRTSILKRTLPGFLHYEDRNSMAFGVETRLPFLDYRIVERVMPFGGRFKLKDGKTKYLLRQALQTVVPSCIINRLEKQGFPAPLGDWLRSAKPKLESDWLQRVRGCPLIRFQNWLRHYRRFMTGDNDELHHLWRGLILSLWYHRFKAVSS